MSVERFLELFFGNVAPFATLFGVWFGHWLGANKSNKEKILEARRQAYGKIISDLKKVEVILDSADEHIQENSMRYFNEDISNVHDRKIASLIASAENIFSDEYLVLSDEFIRLYEEFKAEQESIDSSDLPPDQHDFFAKVVRKHRPVLLAHARKEISL